MKDSYDCPACAAALDLRPGARGIGWVYFCEFCLKEFGTQQIEGQRINPDGRRALVIEDTRNGQQTRIDRVESRVNHLKKRAWTWANVVKPVVEGRHEYVLKMVTLTYAPGVDWQPNHIRDYMLSVRKSLVDALCAYAWVAELQKRGAVHYHVLLWVKGDVYLPTPDKSGAWAHGMSKVEIARTPFYIFKYAQKGFDSDLTFPRGLRLFAVWIREGFVSDFERYVFRMSALPGWLSDIIEPAIDEFPVRTRGGGWAIGSFWVASPFELVDIPGDG